MLMGEFVDHLQQKYSNNGLLKQICSVQPDLEFLLEQLEEIRSKNYLDGPAALGIPRLHNSSETQDLAKEASQLISRVKKEVYRHYRSIEELTNINAFVNVMEQFDPNVSTRVIFTTNYDNAIEHLAGDENAFDIVDGFEHKARKHSYIWSRDVFDKYEHRESETSTVVLFKLHGSANWVRNGKVITQSEPIYSSDDKKYGHVLIYPAKRKVAIDEPFFTAYDYLEKCLSSASDCLVIGYSFRDYDTLMRFKAASLGNDKLRVLVLDPSADNLVKTLKGHDIRAVGLPYHFVSQEDKYTSELARLMDRR
jgi:SIR2-like protein